MQEKECPFKDRVCNETCELFIKLNDLNETMASRLKSISVVSHDDDYGLCSLKLLALSQARNIFELSRGFMSH